MVVFNAYSPSSGTFLIIVVIRCNVFVTALLWTEDEINCVLTWQVEGFHELGCLFMMPIDGYVKECSLSVTWGYFDIVLDNE